MHATAHRVYGHGERVCTQSWLWKENPLPHQGIKPASAVWWSDALTNWATSNPVQMDRWTEWFQYKYRGIKKKLKAIKNVLNPCKPGKNMILCTEEGAFFWPTTETKHLGFIFLRLSSSPPSFHQSWWVNKIPQPFKPLLLTWTIQATGTGAPPPPPTQGTVFEW